MSLRVLPPEGGVPIYLWAREVDEAALRQLRHLAGQPYVFSHVAAMADVHVAGGVSVGTVFASRDTLVPAALGGDLGCGMCALRFPHPAAALSRDRLRRLLRDLAAAVPVGDAVQRRPLPLPAELAAPLSTRALCRRRDALAPRHLGTLGGGNHFLELERDAGGDLWLLLHSGSRGVGAAIGAHHAQAAQARGGGPLAGLPAESEAGQALLHDLDFALRFAAANRRALLDRAAAAVAEATGCDPDAESLVDLHHNFIAREEHQGEAVYVHRKGATRAAAAELGLIPGSMGTASYLVRGRGCPASFSSCSHGAGRVMTRTQARARIRPQALRGALRRVVFDEARISDLVEEAPAAYRDIATVLADQEDLVEPVLRFTPIAVLKG